MVPAPIDVIAIGELSRRTRCNIETIRYYRRIGLLPTPSRRGRYRTYAAADIARLGFVRRSRELLFTIKEVHALHSLEVDGVTSCLEARALRRRTCTMFVAVSATSVG